MNHDKLPRSKFPSLLPVTTFSTPSHAHLFVQCWAVSLQKLRGSLTQAALGAFVVSCQLGQPLLARAVFSAFHSAPALPLVLLGGSRRLCRRLSTRPAPSGVGRFFLLSAGSSLPPALVLLGTSLIHTDPCVEGDSLRIASCFRFTYFWPVFILYNTVI